jgi:hypothetical protein
MQQQTVCCCLLRRSKPMQTPHVQQQQQQRRRQRHQAPQPQPDQQQRMQQCQQLVQQQPSSRWTMQTLQRRCRWSWTTGSLICWMSPSLAAAIVTRTVATLALQCFRSGRQPWDLDCHPRRSASTLAARSCGSAVTGEDQCSPTASAAANNAKCNGASSGCSWSSSLMARCWWAGIKDGKCSGSANRLHDLLEGLDQPEQEWAA